MSEIQTPTPVSNSGETSLFSFLTQNEFHLGKDTTNIIEKIITNGNRKTFLLRGPAGTGKTHLTWLVSRWLNSEYIYYQCTYGASEDELLYKYVPSEQSKSGIKITLGPIPRALMMSQKRKVVLVLDEFDKTRPSSDALLLDVLQNYRLSLYLDDNETIITGNPDNLIVFLTSNDMREFSEPLLRRLVTLTLKPLQTAIVYGMLKKQFKENIALLLTQIYDDTLKAGLRKPATIQELTQLGEILERLESGVNIQLNELLRMFVVKYEDDWAKYVQYVQSREPYNFTPQSSDNDNVAQYYEPQEEVQISQPQKQAESTTSTAKLLERISRIVVKQPNTSVVGTVKEEVTETMESTFKASINENDFAAYTNIIKALKPVPTDVPDIFGKFKIVKDTNEYEIMAEEPLTLLEYFKLLSKSGEVEFEGYIEDRLVLTNPTAINKIVDSASTVRYYTSNRIQVIFNSDDVTELIEVELENGKYNPKKLIENELEEVVIRMHANVKKHGSFDSLMLNLINQLNDVNVNAPNPEMLVKFIKQSIEYRRHYFSPSVGITLHFGNTEDVDKIMKTLSEAFKVNIRDIDEIRRKMAARIYYDEYDGVLEVRSQ